MEPSRRAALPDGIWALRTPVADGAEVADEHVVAWARAHGLVRSAAAEQRLAAVRLGDFAARVYPTATHEDLLLLTDWIAWLDFLDDQNDDAGAALEPSGFEAFVARLAQIGPPNGDAGHHDTGLHDASHHDAGPLGDALEDLWRRTRPRAGARLRRRLHHHLVEYLTGNVQQAAYRTLGEVCDPAEYPALRRAAGGIAVTFDLVEIAAGAELPPELYYSPTYQRLLNSAGDVVCWTNDILTVDKETAAGDLLNLVTVIEVADRCTRSQALERAEALTSDRLDAFHRAEADLPRLSTQRNLSAEEAENLNTCVALLRAWIRGHADWGVATSRYSSRPLEADALDELMTVPASTPAPPTTQAIVIGAGIGGLTTARVLADHFPRVLLLEAGALPSTPGPRTGVPQARHVHGMLARGAAQLEELFPGLRDQLVAAGAPLFDHGLSASTTVFAGRIPRTQGGVPAHGFSRDLLEWALRERIRALPTVTIRDNAPVSGLCWNEDATRVTGVKLAAGGQVDATLVVDASGRFSALPQWLTDAGYQTPEERTVDAGLAYATMLFTAPDQHFEALQHMNNAPDSPRGAYAVRTDNDRWVVTLFGAGGDHPPTDASGWRDFARSLGNPDLDGLLDAAKPTDATTVHAFKRTENRLRRYATMRRWPAGLVALGDAVAAFDPVFGQGMTVSVLQAAALGREISTDDAADIRTAAEHSQRIQRHLATIARLPWLMAISEDLAWQHHRAHRKPPLWLRAGLWYKRRLIQLLVVDPATFRTFLRVYHMLKPPIALFSPRIAAKVLFGTRRHTS